MGQKEGNRLLQKFELAPGDLVTPWQHAERKVQGP